MRNTTKIQYNCGKLPSLSISRLGIFVNESLKTAKNDKIWVKSQRTRAVIKFMHSRAVCARHPHN